MIGERRPADDHGAPQTGGSTHLRNPGRIADRDTEGQGHRQCDHSRRETSESISTEIVGVEAIQHTLSCV